MGSLISGTRCMSSCPLICGRMSRAGRWSVTAVTLGCPFPSGGRSSGSGHEGRSRPGMSGCSMVRPGCPCSREFPLSAWNRTGRSSATMCGGMFGCSGRLVRRVKALVDHYYLLVSWTLLDPRSERVVELGAVCGCKGFSAFHDVDSVAWDSCATEKGVQKNP